jgi:hypothetical protein
LIPEELYEVSKRAGFQNGEIGDALPHVAAMHFGGGGVNRLLPSPDAMNFCCDFHCREEPDYRNLQAFDFVYSELNASVRGAQGMRGLNAVSL